MLTDQNLNRKEEIPNPEVLIGYLESLVRKLREAENLEIVKASIGGKSATVFIEGKRWKLVPMLSARVRLEVEVDLVEEGKVVFGFL